MPIAPITDIIEDFKAGRMVVLVDDEDRENEGDLVFAADFVTPEKINFLAKIRPRPGVHADHRRARASACSSRR